MRPGQAGRRAAGQPAPLPAAAASGSCRAQRPRGEELGGSGSSWWSSYLKLWAGTLLGAALVRRVSW